MRKFLKFCAVGVGNTAISFCTFYILCEVLGVNYLISSFTGYVVGIINSFILNKKWTFQDSQKKVFYQLIKFITLNIGSLGINLLLMYICVDKLNVSKVLSQIIAIGFSTIVNYVGSRFIIFKDVHSADKVDEFNMEKLPELQKTK